MKFRLIACNVFLREACHCVARTPHVVDVEFTELGDHVHSASLRAAIQARIDAASDPARGYDAVLLLYGICGNATVGLCARATPLVIPRAHDCCGILLGSREKVKQHFAANPSLPFSSAGYMERGEYYLRVEDGESRLHYGDAFAEYVRQYGEENARYIWEAMHPAHAELPNQAVYIDLPETSHLGYAARFRERALADGKEYVQLDGSLRLVQDLIFGVWNADDFLVVQPGQRVAGVYDWSEVIRAQDGEPPGDAQPG